MSLSELPPGLFDLLLPSVNEYVLKLMSSLNNISQIPNMGRNLMIVASVNSVLHFRVFAPHGKVVVDVSENNLNDLTPQLVVLKEQLQGLWSPHYITPSEEEEVINTVTSIIGPIPVNGRAGALRDLESLFNSRAKANYPDTHPLVYCPEDYGVPDPSPEIFGPNSIRHMEALISRSIRRWDPRLRNPTVTYSTEKFTLMARIAVRRGKGVKLIPIKLIFVRTESGNYVVEKEKS